MKITLEIPDRTVAAVINLVIDEITQYTIVAKIIDSDMIKDGAEFNLLPEPPKEDDQ